MCCYIWHIEPIYIEIQAGSGEKYYGTVAEDPTATVNYYSYKTNPDTLSGRTEGGKIVNFVASKSAIGTFVDVKITESRTWSLVGEQI